ncbi:hypothetical protein M0R45_018711 [Rubus argutus]|uniref:K Homology domain-containing protein n=1 Tax=Rubus argutus TaxID=59490 RepID=A0AAW1X5Q1_RUBAR
MATAQPSENGSAKTPDPDPQPTSEAPATTSSSDAISAADKRWPGWPGDCVFRLIVPVLKVGSIIGRKGELIKKMCEETRARIRVLEGAAGTSDRIVLISGREEPEAPLSPCNGCSSTPAINLIGKQGSLIKSIQESTAASVRVLSGEEVPFYAAADERIIEVQGETLKVLKALEAVVSHLRKFLVDHSVLPLFEKTYTAPISQERQPDTWADKSLLHSSTHTGGGTNYPLTTTRESLFLNRLGRPGAPIVTQITQTMQIPLSYAEDIIGVEGRSIEFIRRSSGAFLTVQESRGLPDEITVEIKGTSSQVQAAQQLIQEVIATSTKDQIPSSYGRMDTGLRSSYSQLDSTSYPSSSVSSLPYDAYGSSLQSQQPYGSSGLGGGYSTFRL